MSPTEIAALIDRLQKYCGTLAPPIARGLMHEAHRALAALSDQLTAKTELATLYAASLHKVEEEVEGLRRDAQRYRRIRLCRSDRHGDVYAMVFAADGDYPEDGDELDRIVDAAIVGSGKEE